MKLYKGKEVEVLEVGTNLSVVKYVGDEDYKSFNVNNADLTEKKVVLTDVQRALATDPTTLTELLAYVERIEISSSPSGVALASVTISESSSITEIDAVDYIRVVSDRTHDAKYDVIVRDTIPTELRDRSKVFFNESGHRARAGELQISSKPLASWLMGQGVLPENQTEKRIS